MPLVISETSRVMAGCEQVFIDFSLYLGIILLQTPSGLPASAGFKFSGPVCPVDKAFQLLLQYLKIRRWANANFVLQTLRVVQAYLGENCHVAPAIDVGDSMIIGAFFFRPRHGDSPKHSGVEFLKDDYRSQKLAPFPILFKADVLAHFQEPQLALFKPRYFLARVCFSFLLIPSIKGVHIQRIASIPDVISETSRVMAAWRTLLKVRVRSPAISLALSVALFIATRRAECSEAFASSSE